MRSAPVRWSKAAFSVGGQVGGDIRHFGEQRLRHLLQNKLTDSKALRDDEILSTMVVDKD